MDSERKRRMMQRDVPTTSSGGGRPSLMNIIDGGGGTREYQGGAQVFSVDHHAFRMRSQFDPDQVAYPDDGDYDYYHNRPMSSPARKKTTTRTSAGGGGGHARHTSRGQERQSGRADPNNLGDIVYSPDNNKGQRSEKHRHVVHSKKSRGEGGARSHRDGHNNQRDGASPHRHSSAQRSSGGGKGGSSSGAGGPGGEVQDSKQDYIRKLEDQLLGVDQEHSRLCGVLVQTTLDQRLLGLELEEQEVRLRVFHEEQLENNQLNARSMRTMAAINQRLQDAPPAQAIVQETAMAFVTNDLRQLVEGNGKRHAEQGELLKGMLLEVDRGLGKLGTDWSHFKAENKAAEEGRLSALAGIVQSTSLHAKAETQASLRSELAEYRNSVEDGQRRLQDHINKLVDRSSEPQLQKLADLHTDTQRTSSDARTRYDSLASQLTALADQMNRLSSEVGSASKATARSIFTMAEDLTSLKDQQQQTQRAPTEGIHMPHQQQHEIPRAAAAGAPPSIGVEAPTPTLSRAGSERELSPMMSLQLQETLISTVVQAVREEMEKQQKPNQLTPVAAATTTASAVPASTVSLLSTEAESRLMTHQTQSAEGLSFSMQRVLKEVEQMQEKLTETNNNLKIASRRADSVSDSGGSLPGGGGMMHSELSSTLPPPLMNQNPGALSDSSAQQAQLTAKTQELFHQVALFSMGFAHLLEHHQQCFLEISSRKYNVFQDSMVFIVNDNFAHFSRLLHQQQRDSSDAMRHSATPPAMPTFGTSLNSYTHTSPGHSTSISHPHTREQQEEEGAAQAKRRLRLKELNSEAKQGGLFGCCTADSTVGRREVNQVKPMALRGPKSVQLRTAAGTKSPQRSAVRLVTSKKTSAPGSETKALATMPLPDPREGSGLVPLDDTMSDPGGQMMRQSDHLTSKEKLQAVQANSLKNQKKPTPATTPPSQSLGTPARSGGGNAPSALSLALVDAGGAAAGTASPSALKPENEEERASRRASRVGVVAFSSEPPPPASPDFTSPSRSEALMTPTDLVGESGSPTTNAALNNHHAANAPSSVSGEPSKLADTLEPGVVPPAATVPVKSLSPAGAADDRSDGSGAGSQPRAGGEERPKPKPLSQLLEGQEQLSPKAVHQRRSSAAVDKDDVSSGLKAYTFPGSPDAAKTTTAGTTAAAAAATGHLTPNFNKPSYVPTSRRKSSVVKKPEGGDDSEDSLSLSSDELTLSDMDDMSDAEGEPKSSPPLKRDSNLLGDEMTRRRPSVNSFFGSSDDDGKSDAPRAKTPVKNEDGWDDDDDDEEVAAATGEGQKEVEDAPVLNFSVALGSSRANSGVGFAPSPSLSTGAGGVGEDGGGSERTGGRSNAASPPQEEVSSPTKKQNADDFFSGMKKTKPKPNTAASSVSTISLGAPGGGDSGASSGISGGLGGPVKSSTSGSSAGGTESKPKDRRKRMLDMLNI